MAFAATSTAYQAFMVQTTQEMGISFSAMMAPIANLVVRGEHVRIMVV
jgi:hypothetical protein